MNASLELPVVAYDTAAATSEMRRMGRGKRHIARAHSARAKTWVAELIPYLGTYQRRFLRGNLDAASGTLSFILSTDRIYEVSAPADAWHADRYYCTVSDDGRIIRLENPPQL